jgi:hypothetical protein
METSFGIPRENSESSIAYGWFRGSGARANTGEHGADRWTLAFRQCASIEPVGVPIGLRKDLDYRLGFVLPPDQRRMIGIADFG